MVNVMKKILLSLVLVLVLLPVLVYAQLELVSYWSFDDSTNPEQDEVGGNDGTVYGATWTADGIKNGAMTFDGEDDYVDCGSDTSLDLENFTIIAWVKLYETGPDYPSKNNNLVAKKYGTIGWSFFVYQNIGKLSFDFFYESGSGHQSYVGDTELQTDTWYHVAITVSNGNSIKFYLNGTPDGEATPTESFIYPDRPLMIGKSESGYYGGFTNGTIDEVKVYNHVLSEAEILQDYNDEGLIYSPADLNKDGAVDIYDLVIVTSHFGKTQTHPDWNNTSDVIIDEEIDIYDLVFVASRFFTLDTILPEVTFFDVQPRNTTDSITALWNVTDERALKQTGLWRTNDDSGQPDEVNWSLVSGQIQSVSGTHASGQFIDTPPDGIFWYNLHVIDSADNTGYAQPIDITKSVPPPCIGICKPNACDSYDNCTNASGTCLLGYCCSGSCFTIPSNESIVYADSCSRADIQTAHDAANDGDMIIIPEGDCTFDFPYRVDVSKAVAFQGQGPSKTIMRKNSDSQFYGMFDCFRDAGTGPDGISFSDMKLVGEGSETYLDAGIILFRGYTNFRVYNIVFEGFGSEGIRVDGRTGWGSAVKQPYGVIYNCTFIDCYLAGQGYGVNVVGDLSWENPLILGDANAVFVEDCVFSGCRHTIANNGGGKYVFRYNTITSNRDAAYIDAHGKNAYAHGSRSYEIYENTLSHPTSYTVAVNTRGGDGVVFNNTMTNFIGDSIILFVNEICPGCGDYPCSDQTREAYIWGNTNNGNPVNGTPTECQTTPGEYVLRENRDIFNYEKPGYTPYPYPHPLRAGVG